MVKTELFYVGEKFYWESGTMMSSIYSVVRRKRWDWGSVRTALDRGDEVMIRPATAEEMKWALGKLASLKLWQGYEDASRAVKDFGDAIA